MDAIQLLAEIRGIGVRLVLDQDRLLVQGSTEKITVELQERLRAHKPALMRLLMAAQKTAAIPARPAALRKAQRFPQSYAQQRLWFLNQLDRNAGAAYHLPAAVQLKGRLDKAALRAALDRMVARHESLRTTFSVVDGEPVQHIGPADQGMALPEHDLSTLDDGARDAEIRRLGRLAACTPFDLGTGPLIRAELLHLDERRHVLLVTQHHIISDGWSVSVLLRELGVLYAAFCDGEDDPLPPLALQYADYAVWQRDWLRGTELARQLEFWKHHLAQAPTLLALPTDRPRPALQSYAGASVAFVMPPAHSAALHAWAQRHQVTPFMCVLAALSILLGRLSGTDDVVIGTPVANRQRPEVEPLIGFFVNTLALRINTADDPCVTDLLARVKNLVGDAHQHQDVPFDQVVEALKQQRSMAYSPLFQVMLTVSSSAEHIEMSLPGLSLRGIDLVEATTAHFDLSFALHASEGALSGTVNYASDLFDRATVERWVAYLQTLLVAMVEHDSLRSSQLPLMTAAQRQQLLCDFNANSVDYSHERLLHQQFEQQVLRAPDAVALRYEGRQLSYGELNRRANRVAHYLRALGIQPDQLVALCVERGLDMVVGLLGIMKAGAAYVPMDPAYPAQRLEAMLEDCAPRALLTQQALRADWMQRSGVTHLLLDADAAQLARLPDHDPDPAAIGLRPDHLAYVIYTSGSTGQPKGVMVAHRSAFNFWEVMRRTTHRGCPPQANIGLNASYAFDMSLKGLLQLLSGHTVVIVPQALRADANRLCAFLETHRIDAFDCTPSQLELLLEAGLLENPRYHPVSVLIGGEPISAKTWDRLRQSSTTGFFNMYGPTEATVDATLGLIRVTDATPHIGRPLANARIYILDPAGEPVPPGVAGEIHIGGAGVARGYLRRPELTAERFVPDRFGDDGAARLYKTGDLGRWRMDGNIEYLGRNDFQVKIRGFRIELGEVEALLLACDGVKEAVVVAADLAGGPRLVAYVVAEAGAVLSADRLRRQLAGTAAGHMVPAAFVVLPALPLNMNGKLDRKGLPQPALEAVVSRAYEAPLEGIEAQVAAIWRGVLGLERVGRHDDFFELGGHSLLAMQMVALIHRQCGVEVALRELFAQSTLCGFAAAVAAGRGAVANLVAVRAEGSARPLFLVHPGEGEIAYAVELAAWIDDSVPVYGLAASGFLDGESPLATVEEMARRYVQAIRARQPQGPYRIGGWSAGGTIAMEMARQLAQEGASVDFLGLIDTLRSYPPLPQAAGASPDAAALIAWLPEWSPAPVQEQLRDLAARDDVDGMLLCCQAAGLLPQAVALDVLRRHLAVRLAVASAVRRYVPERSAAPVTLFVAADENRADRTLGWAEWLGPQLRVQTMPGDHRSIVAGPHARALGRAITAALGAGIGAPQVDAQTGSEI